MRKGVRRRYNVQNRDNLSNFDTSNVYSYVKRFCPADIIRNRGVFDAFTDNRRTMPRGVTVEQWQDVDQKVCSQYILTKHVCH